MDIREFVTKALTEILDGVREAQASADGAFVNAAVGDTREMGGSLFQAQFGVFTRVDFDLAVTTETTVSGEGGGKLLVIGAKASASATNHNLSRVAFSVPVQIPNGDQTALEAYRARQERTIEEARRKIDERTQREGSVRL